MKLDLTPLVNANNSLEESIAVVSDEKWFDAQPKAVRNTLIAGVIQNFEFVYELSVKMIRRRIELDAVTPTDADFGDYRELLRTAAERGLIADVEDWFDYRTLRNITSHAYDHNKAMQVYRGTLAFLGDARALLKTLEARYA
ncbi:MAG: nucleotidyltransferase substrate binding protein [Gammaproteobacteria bacterium]